MFYLVEIGQMSLVAWRLQNDGTWRDVFADRRLKEGDRKFLDPADAVVYRQRDLQVNFNGMRIAINESRSSGSGMSARFWLHRDEPPAIPSKKQLADVIRAGDDDHLNALVLTAEGHFELVDRTVDFEGIHHPRIAVRMETFGAGNDYVGERAARSKSFVDQLYRDYLALWIDHVRGGRLNIFSDMGEVNRNEDRLLAELEAIIALRQWA